MGKNYLIGSNEKPAKADIFANRSALVIYWLLTQGIEKDSFSIREVSSATGVSLGQVHKVFNQLILNGFLYSDGFRTSKQFFLKNPPKLLSAWANHYNITQKCTFYTYSTPFSTREHMLTALKRANLSPTLALHSAAEHKNTNLETLEIYLSSPTERQALEKALDLEPQERGYQVLLILPYYKSLLSSNISPPLLTYLDLLHFPLRGTEQASHLASKKSSLRRIINT